MHRKQRTILALPVQDNLIYSLSYGKQKSLEYPKEHETYHS